MKRTATNRARVASRPGRKGAFRVVVKKKSAKRTAKTTAKKTAFRAVSKKMGARTARKRAMVTMPRAQYERLLALAAEAEEEAAAARLIARARRELAAGREVLIPLAVADRLADGENPVKVIREWRGLTQQQLAAAAGITQGYLSEIENRGRQGPLALHQTLARALNVQLQTLTRD
jgi:DNA-binding XRE family transcriptional regulator